MCDGDVQVKRDEEHKVVKSKDAKDDEVARVPIAFAMVKLMQSLPQHVMEAHLPGYVRDLFRCTRRKLSPVCACDNGVRPVAAS